jgi:predicted transcriptional regulator
MTTASVPMSLRVDPAIKERLQAIAQRHKRSAHALAQEAVVIFVEKQEAKDRLNQEAMEAYNDYRTTGLHLTHEELDTWLDTWGTENEQAAPQCHV